MIFFACLITFILIYFRLLSLLQSFTSSLNQVWINSFFSMNKPMFIFYFWSWWFKSVIWVSETRNMGDINSIHVGSEILNYFEKYEKLRFFVCDLNHSQSMIQINQSRGKTRKFGCLWFESHEYTWFKSCYFVIWIIVCTWFETQTSHLSLPCLI